MAFDLISTDILNIKSNEEGILYLDSENDNPAFRMASATLGITSDRDLPQSWIANI
jgi:hypothetical protein